MESIDKQLIPVKIKSIYVHPTKKVPVLFLVDDAGEIVVPITVGFLEAQAIISSWQNIFMPRPVTADLLQVLIEKDFGATVEKIVIHDIHDGAFIATLYIAHQGKILERDCRPSDAMALAVRTNSGIFITDNLKEKLEEDQENARALLQFLDAESIDSSDIIKF